ncbi:MAG: zf-HC2 domain-containing protein [Bryobacteraceae bacterium]|nr:zf-HC2 domain-containing protein [Solibacteraceae bacterium]MCL4842172.1 zf-HC2 domain-containing protein [Bryobacteraceae bacterium]MCO5352087.1 zf-HC2 domain-containing protein [Bryobacteraceae bacterium]
MVTCKDFLRELGEYLDETTDPATRSALEKHITECPNCWVVFDTCKKTIQVYKGMDPQPLPDPVHERLMKALERKAVNLGLKEDCSEAKA